MSRSHKDGRKRGAHSRSGSSNTHTGTSDVPRSDSPHSTKRAATMLERTALYEVSRELARQDSKGYDAAHDDKHVNGELVHAAEVALTAAEHELGSKYAHQNHSWFRHTPVEHTSDEWLVIAAALIVSEIERRKRAARRESAP